MMIFAEESRLFIEQRSRLFDGMIRRLGVATAGAAAHRVEEEMK